MPRACSYLCIPKATRTLALMLCVQDPGLLIRILVPKPVLYVRAIGSAKDAMLIRLTKKRDQRVVKTSFSNVTVANKGGFRREDVFKLILQESPDGFFSVSPEKELPSGEYLLVLGNAVPAYDFGIDRKK